MITFKQFVAEVADKKVQYEVLTQTANRFKAKSTVNGRDIVFKAFDTEDPDEGWDVSFSEVERDTYLQTAAATGSGGEFEVAALIVAIMKEFVSRYEPAIISYTAEKSKQDDPDNTRAAVYRRLLKRHFPQYTINEKIVGRGKIAVVYLYRKS